MFGLVLCLNTVLTTAINYVVCYSKISRATLDYLQHQYATVLALVRLANALFAVIVSLFPSDGLDVFAAAAAEGVIRY